MLFAESCTRRLRCLVSLSSSLCPARCLLSRGFIAFVLPLSFAVFVKESAALLLQRTPLCGFFGVFRVVQTLLARLAPGVWLWSARDTERQLQASPRRGQGSGQRAVRSPRFYFSVCCACLLPRASLFPSLCLSFFLCNAMLTRPCCIWVLRELGWRGRQGPKLAPLAGSGCLWQQKTFFSCVCLDADAQTSSAMACTWVEDNWGVFEVLGVRCSLYFLFFAWRTGGQEAFEMDPSLWE